jgi:RND family efflux transporter MFP subunit
MFSGAPNTQVGKAAIVTIMQVNPLKAMVSISQTFYQDVKKGMKTRISTDIIPGIDFEGEVTQISPTINPMTRTFQAEVVVKNPNEALRPGMYADIEIALLEDDVVMLPAISILKQSGTNNRHIFVFEDGKARQIEVGIGKRIDDLVEVICTESLEGKRLIVEGQARLTNGSEVKLATD